MSRTYHHGKDRRIRVRGIRRPTDLKRLARALIELEYQQAQVEAEAEAEHHGRPKRKRPSDGERAA
jgi:D-tyrosyl-tRNA(Tyr) deacylase